MTRHRALFAACALALAVAGAAGVWHFARPSLESARTPSGDDAGGLWTCGMHPHVLEHGPGPCPICGMRMVPAAGDPQPGGAGSREILFYRNPMDPTITSPVPAKDEMGMDYVPVYAKEAGGDSSGVIAIDPAIVQNMNVVSEPAVRRDLEKNIRTVGYLEYDQQRMVSVTTKYSGFIEKVYVNYVGEPVRKGQPLFEIYSPELVQTEQELLSSLAFARQMADAPEDTRERADALVEASRRRLRYWDIAEEQIRRVEKTGEVFRTLTVTAPAGGVVMMRRSGLEGMAANAGMELYHIADLSTLWLSVEVFEGQLAWLDERSEAEITFSYFPGETFTGTVRYVDPQVSEETRTVSLNLEVPNTNGRLRSGMYATVVFRPVAASDAVTVPASAVIRTGERNVVVVDLGGGRFVSREVRLGKSGSRAVEVLEGIEEGERVVTSAQFLIDSESSLRAAVQMLVTDRTDGEGRDDAR